MKPILACSIVALLLYQARALAQFEIRGNVKDAGENSLPLVTVRIQDSLTAPVQTTSNGGFFLDLRKGFDAKRVTVFFEKDGYESWSQTVDLPPRMVLDVHLNRADFTLTGLIRDHSNQAALGNAIIEIVGFADQTTFSKRTGQFLLSFNAQKIKGDTLVLRVSHSIYDTLYRIIPGWESLRKAKTSLWVDFELEESLGPLTFLWKGNRLEDWIARISFIAVPWLIYELFKPEPKSETQGQATIVIPK